ncbi:RagB/SusD family nutrient uptake outer membrane protein [Chitinophaga lutea]
MKKILIICTFIVGCSQLSCTKMLELEPVSEISNSSFWKTESDVQGALAGMYVLLRNQATNNLFLWGEGRSDAMGPNLAAPVFQTWDKNILTPDNANTIFSGASTTWQGMYGIVNACNLIIKQVPGIPFSTEAKRNNALAQAYAMRAYVYYVMARTWGDVVLVVEPTSNLDGLQRERTPVAEVFQQIKVDVAKAISLFPDNALADGRKMWSLPALYALKADVFLWTGKRMNGGAADFQEALAACNEVQKADVGLLPSFGNVFEYTNKGNREILFSVRRVYEETTEPTIYAWMYILDTWVPNSLDAETKAALLPTAGAPYWAPSNTARLKFTDDDTRKKPTIIELYTVDGGGNKTFFSSVVGKFNGTVVAGQRYFIDDYIIYRYADVLLMKAEAKNALGQDPSAEINDVRRRAYGAAFPAHEFVSGTPAANDAAILDERFRELMFEGKRWWDLIRFNKAFDLVPSLQGRGADQHLLLWPIAISTISLNSKLIQNDGY